MTKEQAIATRGLTKRFDRHTAIRDVELEISSGEVYGLIGPNGAGKTTLIRLLAAAEEPTAGEIYFWGDRLRQDNSNTILKQRLGYLPDDFPLYEDLTVWDYLDYFARLYHLKNPHRRRRLYEVLELVQLTAKRRSLISTLSRGMKQRLSLARTIIHEPILLLLDEPVSGLDSIASIQFHEIIKVLQEAGMTIIISSHVLSDLEQLCTSIGIMEMGYLVESTSVQNLSKKFSHQQIIISTLGDLEKLQEKLNQNPNVEEWKVLGDRKMQISFAGSSEGSAELLRSLVTAGIPITDFHQTKVDLESIFLRLGHQQAS